MQVVVVESPGKVASINKYLGPRYKVMASYGHIRDLPSKDGSVKPDDDFAMIWEVDGRGAKRVKEIADAMKSADGLILATDPDREGEAISWHLHELLKAQGALKALGRQALHAHILSVKHPKSAEILRFRSELPPDLARLRSELAAMRADSGEK